MPFFHKVTHASANPVELNEAISNLAISQGRIFSCVIDALEMGMSTADVAEIARRAARDEGERYAAEPLEKVWAYREEALYPELFGNISRGIFPLEARTFADLFGQEDIDPRWLFLGVFEFEPTPTRNSWLYVTSGASTPWETAPEDYRLDQYSWLGVEFVIEVPEQANWPIHVLRRLLTYHLLASVGRLGQATPFDYGHRIPAGGSVDGSPDTKLTDFAIARPTHYKANAQLDSGRFDFLHIVGITEDERDFARTASTEILIAKLEEAGAYPVTDVGRECIPL